MGLRAFALDALPDEPWRNGGGRTRTIATQMREPQAVAVDADNEPPWDWRISVATIERSGPFSAFPGVDRSSMLLGGGRIELSAVGETTLRMRRPGDVAAYRGDPVWHAEVQRARQPLTLLNFMIRRGAGKVRLTALRGDSFLPGRLLAVLVIEGRWRLSKIALDAGRPFAVTLAPGEGARCDSLLPTANVRMNRVSQTGLLATAEIDCNGHSSEGKHRDN